jgi:3-hydroxyacyl-CoA dehydrogenase
MIGNEAFFILEEGLASARDIDKALKLGLKHVKAGRLGKKVGRGVYEYARED